MAVIGLAVTLGCGAAAPAASRAERLAAYVDTADRMKILLTYLPVPGDDYSAEAWMRERSRFATIIDHGRDRFEQPQRRIDLLLAETPTDAWGSTLTARFSAAPYVTILTSAGPDRRVDTDDDLLGVARAEKVIEDGRSVWTFRRTWKAPAEVATAIGEP